MSLVPPTVALDPFGDDFLAAPYDFHAELRDVAPVFLMEKYNIFGIARYEQVAAVLKDYETFCSSRGVGLTDFALEEPWRPASLLLETDPPLHHQTRQIMNRVVSPQALKRVRQKWAERAGELVDRLANGNRFDAITDCAEVFPMVVFPQTIGLREDGLENLLPYAVAAFNAFGPPNPLREDALAAAVEPTKWVNESCKRENLKPGGWGLQVYAAADQGLCSEDDAGRLVRSFLTAGVDTTINGIGNLLYALGSNPEQFEHLKQNPGLVRRAFEEALRWDSTAQTFFRTTTRDVEIDGYEIPSGRKVLLFLAAANRDPRRWESPESFNITRNASGHVAFGFGIHQCLGQMVARLEAEVLLEAIITKVDRIEVVGEPVRRLNNTLHAISGLPVRFIPG